MKIICQRDQLLMAFQTAATVAPARSPKSILRNVKLSVTESDALVMATDMEVGIRIDVDGIEVESTGTLVLPVSQFGAILRESSDQKLHIETDESGTIVRGDRSEFRLATENPDEFPNVAAFEEESYHEVPVKLLKELIRRTLFATDAESSRYALGGVLLEMDGEEITAVATDGRRLARMKGPAQSIGGHKTGDAMTIVPARAMQLIDRALGDGDAEIRVAARANDIMVKSPRVMIYSRLVEGRFPKWRDAFPEPSDSHKLELSVGPLYSALRQAAIVSSDQTRGVDFALGGGNLVITGNTAEVGRSRVEMPIPYDGPAMTLTLDHRFVADFLKVLDPDKTVVIDVAEGNAVLFSTDDGYGYVVMPMARET